MIAETNYQSLFFFKKDKTQDDHIANFEWGTINGGAQRSEQVLSTIHTVP